MNFCLSFDGKFDLNTFLSSHDYFITGAQG